MSANVPSPEAPGFVPCLECGKCCTYVAVGINAPTKPRYATDILWYLYHDKVNVYVDGDGEWCVQFETRCKNLGEGLLCAVYPDRPHICRSFDNRSCEVNSPEGEAITFKDPVHFLHWLKERRPRVFRQIEKRFIPPALAEAMAR